MDPYLLDESTTPTITPNNLDSHYARLGSNQVQCSNVLHIEEENIENKSHISFDSQILVRRDDNSSTQVIHESPPVNVCPPMINEESIVLNDQFDNIKAFKQINNFGNRHPVDND